VLHVASVMLTFLIFETTQ